MKKRTTNVKTLLLVNSLVIITMLSSCGMDNNIEETRPTDNMKKSTIISNNKSSLGIKDNFSKIDSTTKILSENIIKLGVNEIIKDGIFFTLKTYKPFKIKDRFESLSKYEFKYSDNILSFKDDTSYQVYSIDGEFYIHTPYYNGLLKEMNQDSFNKDEKLLYLLIFLGEIDESKNLKTDYATVENEHSRIYGGGCSFFNTYYTIGVGLTAGAANANFLSNLWNDLDGEYSNHKSCRNLGGAESTHVGHVYITTMAFCCS